MKHFLDTSILVESCLSQSSKFAAAVALVNQADSFTSAHALVETYATLSGDRRLKINPADAAQMVEDLAKTLQVHSLAIRDCQQLIGSAPGKGIRGGMIYDALHAQSARLCGCEEIHTLNVAHLNHVAPDLKVVGL